MSENQHQSENNNLKKGFENMQDLLQSTYKTSSTNKHNVKFSGNGNLQGLSRLQSAEPKDSDLRHFLINGQNLHKFTKDTKYTDGAQNYQNVDLEMLSTGHTIKQLTPKDGSQIQNDILRGRNLRPDLDGQMRLAKTPDVSQHYRGSLLLDAQTPQGIQYDQTNRLQRLRKQSNEPLLSANQLPDQGTSNQVQSIFQQNNANQAINDLPKESWYEVIKNGLNRQNLQDQQNTKPKVNRHSLSNQNSIGKFGVNSVQSFARENTGNGQHATAADGQKLLLGLFQQNIKHTMSMIQQEKIQQMLPPQNGRQPQFKLKSEGRYQCLTPQPRRNTDGNDKIQMRHQGKLASMDILNSLLVGAVGKGTQSNNFKENQISRCLKQFSKENQPRVLKRTHEQNNQEQYKNQMDNSIHEIKDTLGKRQKTDQNRHDFGAARFQEINKPMHHDKNEMQFQSVFNKPINNIQYDKPSDITKFNYDNKSQGPTQRKSQRNADNHNLKDLHQSPLQIIDQAIENENYANSNYKDKIDQNSNRYSMKTRYNENSSRKTQILPSEKQSVSNLSGDDFEHTAEQSPIKKKDKKLVFLSRSVLQCVRENPMTTGTEIAYKILDLYKRFSDKVDFKNVQRRVYDALNVLSAMEIIEKQKNHIIYNSNNEFIDDTILPNTVPQNINKTNLEQLQDVSPVIVQMVDPEKESKKRIAKHQQKKEQLQKQIEDTQKLVNQNMITDEHYQTQQVNCQNYISELLKQHIAMSKLIKRNREQPQDSEERRSLPFILIKFMPQSEIDILQDKNKLQFILHSTKQFDVMNENHLFEGMGLTKINSHYEFQNIFDPNLRELLMNRGFTDQIFGSSPGMMTDQYAV